MMPSLTQTILLASMPLAAEVALASPHAQNRVPSRAHPRAQSRGHQSIVSILSKTLRPCCAFKTLRTLARRAFKTLLLSQPRNGGARARLAVFPQCALTSITTAALVLR